MRVMRLNPSPRSLLPTQVAAGVIALAGVVCVALAPFIGSAIFDNLWGIEPLTYIGGLLLIAGLAVAALGYLIAPRRPEASPSLEAAGGDSDGRRWSRTTQQYFELFDHDLGRPLRRIAGKERELRAVLDSTGEKVSPAVTDLLDEIERQTPNFRLMLANIQVLVQLESPGPPQEPAPVEPAEVVRRIAGRYTPVASETGKEVSWWAEPAEFGIVYTDTNAMEHVVTNLVDNAVRFASHHVEVRLSRNPSHFFVRVWDDGPGIGSQYLPHLFDRGWTPEVARREEKTSSGLGLFIARTLARKSGGDLTVDSAAGANGDHHTAFLLSLPLNAHRAPVA